MADLYIAYKVLLIAVGIAFIGSIVYMLLLYCFAKLLVWLTLLAFLVLLALIGYFFWDKSLNAVSDGDKLNYQVLAVIFWVIDGILGIVLCCLYDDIALALEVIQTAGWFLFTKFSLFLVPIIALIITCFFFAYWIATVVYIYSVGEITGYGNTPFASVKWDDNTRNVWYYHLFALFWVVAFFLAILQFVVAATAAQWYFTSGSDQSGSGSIMLSLWWTFRYHLGSLAFGSLLLAIIMFIRFIFEYMRVR